MATTTFVPVEVYLRSSYEPDAEYVDGKIEERPAGENDHASCQAAILKWFCRHEDQWGVAATRFRVRDVTVLEGSQPKEQIITHPPLAVFEVLSPENTLQRLKRRLEDYRYGDKELPRGDTFSAKGIVFAMNEIKNLLKK